MMIADRAARIVRLRADGRKWREVAKAMRVDLKTAHKHGTRAGAPAASARFLTRQADARALEALALRRRGLRLREIGARFGVKRSTAHALVARGKRVEARRSAAGLL